MIVMMRRVDDDSDDDALPTQIWSKLGANSSKREFIRAKWEQILHTGKYPTACAPRLLSFCSSPRRYFQRNVRECDETAENGSYRSNCAFDVPRNRDFGTEISVNAVFWAQYRKQITSKLRANLPWLRRFPGVMISLEQVIGPIIPSETIGRGQMECTANGTSTGTGTGTGLEDSRAVG